MQRRTLLVIVALVALFCVVGWGGRAANPSWDTWEYKVISTYGPSVTNPPPNADKLNEVGEKGWELVAIRSGEFPSVGSHQIRTDYYFKRPK